MVGDPGVGKTALVKQYVEKRFETDFLPTLGMEINVKELQIGESVISVAIWDIGGQDHFSFIRPKYYDGATGIILVYDLTSPESYRNLEYWIKDLREMCDEILIVLLGNKSDLVKEIENTSPDYSQLLPILQECREREVMVGWFFTSAKTAKNVDNAFRSLILQILSNEVLEEHQYADES